MDPIMLSSNHGPGNSGSEQLLVQCFLTLVQFHQPKHVVQHLRMERVLLDPLLWTVADPCPLPCSSLLIPCLDGVQWVGPAPTLLGAGSNPTPYLVVRLGSL